MAKKPRMTREQIEKTPWAIEFKRDSPVSYRAALEYALNPKLEVVVTSSDAAGFPQWVIAVGLEDEPGDFWMDAKPTEAEALAVCRAMGWQVVH